MGTVFKIHRRSCSTASHKLRWLFEQPRPASINHRFLLTGSHSKRETLFHELFARMIYNFARDRCGTRNICYAAPSKHAIQICRRYLFRSIRSDAERVSSSERTHAFRGSKHVL